MLNFSRSGGEKTRSEDLLHVQSVPSPGAQTERRRRRGSDITPEQQDEAVQQVGSSTRNGRIGRVCEQLML